MARIRIYIGRHLCTAPRAQKEAEALAAAGHAVTVHGVAYRRDFAARDAALAAGRSWRWQPVADYSVPGRRLAWLATRIHHRTARELFLRTGRITPAIWGYAQPQIQRHALDDPADLTIVHMEGGLAAGEILRQRGCRVGLDLEDWFSRDLSPAQRAGRPVAELERLERQLLAACRYSLTTSAALAEAVAQEYSVPAPSVIYNSFPAGRERPAPAPTGSVRLHWLSLVIGPERGLENLFAALPLVRGEWTLQLRGEVTPAYRDSLLHQLPVSLRARVSFVPIVSADAIFDTLVGQDVGLALDVSAIPSRNLTLTNKFFHYLQAGLAIVASDTAGHREGLARAPEIGRLFTPGDAPSLAAAIEGWTLDPTRLPPARAASRQVFLRCFAHERQSGQYALRAAEALEN